MKITLNDKEMEHVLWSLERIKVIQEKNLQSL